MRVRNSSEFYSLLHALENLDSDWFIHVGEESRPNVFLDDGDYKVPVEKILLERQLLAKLRNVLGMNSRSWRTAEKKDEIRLYVTFYRQFGLTYAQVADILKIPASTLRHDFPELKYNETISKNFKLSTDVFGNQLKANEI